MSLFNRAETISARKEITGIDTFRGIAALLVFLFHFWLLTGSPRNLSIGPFDLMRFFQAGYRGVDIFFVLSGFLLYYSLNYSSKTLGQYYLRRFLRIAPIYYFSLLIIIIFLKPVFLTSLSGLINIFKHLTFIHSFWGNSWNAINPVAWSLSHEMIFYLILPFIFWLGRRNFKRIIFITLAMIAISFIYRDYLFLNFNNSYAEQIFGRLDEFAIGIFISYLFIKISSGEIKFPKILALVLFASGLALFYVLLGIHAQLGVEGIRSNEFTQVTFGFFISLSFGAILLGFLNTFQIIRRFLSLKIFGFMGLISYSFYLWHFVVLEQVLALHLANYLSFILSFGLTFSLSSITYFLIERPFLKSKSG